MDHKQQLRFAVVTILVLGLAAALWWPRPRGRHHVVPPQEFAANPLFRDVAAESGLDFTMNFLPGEQGETFKINLYDHGCGVAVGDYNGDGHDDVYFLNQLGPNALYRNNGDGTFVDVTAAMNLALDDRICVGATFVDYDNTYFEAAVQSEKIKFEYSYGPNTESQEQLAKFEKELEDTLDYRHENVLFGNAFYKALGDGKFVEMSAETNTETFWPWGLATGDFDNDGFVDAFVTTGMGYPFYYWHNYLMMNTGHGRFEDRSFSLGIEPPVGGNYLPESIKGVKSSRSSRCAATADFDGDGRLEIVVNNFNSGPYYFKNQQQGQNYVAFRLRGTRGNRDAIGALIRIQLGDETLVRQVDSAGGYLSCSSKILHFGLGQHTSMDHIEVVWPSGETQVIDPPAVNRLHEIIEVAGVGLEKPAT